MMHEIIATVILLMIFPFPMSPAHVCRDDATLLRAQHHQMRNTFQLSSRFRTNDRARYLMLENFTAVRSSDGMTE